MRAIAALMMALALLGCGASEDETRPPENDVASFEATWRSFISASAELAEPVAPPPMGAVPWEPLVFPECVGAAERVSTVQVTLVWNEPATTPEPPALRFDLALHYQGLSRNYYSSALSSERMERFKLPSNSALIDDPDALFQVGAGLFPRLIDYRVKELVDRDTQAAFRQHTLVMRDFSGGISYAIRRDRPSSDGSAWLEESLFNFLTPICPTSF